MLCAQTLSNKFFESVALQDFQKIYCGSFNHKIAKKSYRLMDIALTGHAVMHCSQTTQRDRKKLS